MQTFAYIKNKKTNFNKTSLFIIHKKKTNLSFVKNIFVFVSFCLCLVFYAITVTVSSTKGFFLGKAQQEKAKIQYSYNIETLNQSKFKKELREKLDGTKNIKKVKFDADLANNKNLIKFALNK